ncbi:hypothetical protein K525DRAFT_257150, partial [Schizophyllum commune Loenen D]
MSLFSFLADICGAMGEITRGRGARAHIDARRASLLVIHRPRAIGCPRPGLTVVGPRWVTGSLDG